MRIGSFPSLPVRKSRNRITHLFHNNEEGWYAIVIRTPSGHAYWSSTTSFALRGAAGVNKYKFGKAVRYRRLDEMSDKQIENHLLERGWTERVL